MKISLQKGQTINAALIPIPNPIRNTIDIVGFSGLSELDYVSMNILCAFISADPDPNCPMLIDISIRTAMELLAKTNAINNAQQQGSIGDNGQ